MTAIVRDVSERHRQQAVLRHQASHDPLTGLPNRSVLNTMLEALSPGQRAALLMLDLDGFKEVNDRLGHAVGDDVLRTMAARLRGALPAETKAFRIGGDEFAVLVSRYRSRDELRRIASAIAEHLQQPLSAASSRLELGASIGVALFPEHTKVGSSLLQCADVAMYTAKGGRSHCAFYDPEADRAKVRNLTITSTLRRAIESGAPQRRLSAQAAASRRVVPKRRGAGAVGTTRSWGIPGGVRAAG